MKYIKKMLIKSFAITGMSETVYFGLDLDFLSPARDVYNLHRSLLNEVVSEVSIRQQLQQNHDLQYVLFIDVGYIQ